MTTTATPTVFVAGPSGRLTEEKTPVATRLLAADSWLVQDGAARAVEGHRRRFAAACAEAGGPPAEQVDAFWDAALSRLPATGEWFPRAELVADGSGTRLQFRIRPAPARTTSVQVWISGRSDQRTLPRRKGPDLDHLGELRAAAIAVGANEALLTTPSGLVLEGATANLLWWDGDALCAVDPTLRVLPGVTSAWVLKLAAERGIPVRLRRAVPADLAGREAWFTNALHGIRPVTAWVGSDIRPGAPRLAAAWQAEWLAATVPLSGGTPLAAATPPSGATPLSGATPRSASTPQPRLDHRSA
ncbi:aminotransferase class IV [Streptomyces syringium]|uniref:aminotransferase class IV n=1 Tax=Streptomyces syringium TaxID=76729 RepID=UPI003D89BE19